MKQTLVKSWFDLNKLSINQPNFGDNVTNLQGKFIISDFEI